MDFGIAAPRGDAVELSGTLTYMAPELLTGQPPNPASDLYAVGILLYQMLVGRTPHLCTRPGETSGSLRTTAGDPLAEESEEAEETVATPDWTLDSQAFTGGITVNPPPDPGAIQPRELQAVNARLADLVRSLLEPDPALRLQHAELALRQLSAIMQELTDTPLPANTDETRESFLQAAELVGRQKELAVLEAALCGMQVGRGGLVLLGGESGVGKSRLLDELRTLALVRGIRTLRGQAISNGGTGYQLFHEALRGLALGTDFSDHDAAILKEVVPELPAILGRAVPDAPALLAKESQERVRRVLLSTLTPTVEPLLLLLEDIHWAQAESCVLLRAMAAAAVSAPLLIVASFRDDEFHDLPAQFKSAQLLPLRRLDPDAILQLSQSMLGDAGVQPELINFLGRETEGNALFIVEVLRALAEEAGGLDAIGEKTLPQHISSGGIRAVVQRRLERAPGWTRELLKLAAVAGRQIDRRVLASQTSQLDLWLQAGTDAAILEVRDSEWRFAHDKLREGLLASLSAPELKSLHCQLGAAIESAYPEGERPLAALADHFAQGGDAVKAAAYASQAGSKALRSGALHEALALLEHACALQEQTEAAPLVRAATLRRLSRTLLGLGRTPESIACVDKALTLLGQPVPKQRADRWLALAREAAVEVRHRFFGVHPEASPRRQAELRELLALIRGTNESLFITNGQHEGLVLVILRALHAAERIQDEKQQVNFLSRLAYASYLAPLHRLGRFYLRRAERLCQRTMPSADQSGFYAMSAYFDTAEGDWDASVEGFHRWIESATRNGFGEQAALGHSSRAATHLLMGNFAGALADGEACFRIGQRMHNPIYTGSGIGWRALVQLRRGEVAAAYDNAKAAQTHVAGLRDSASNMSANGLLAYAAVLSGKPDEAAQQLAAALTRMRRYLPAAPSYQVIYSCVLLASLELASKTQERSPAERALMDQRVRQALLRMVQFAVRFPIGWPHVFLGAGRYLGQQGQHRLALRVLAAGLPIARRYGMRYDEGLLHLWLATLGVRGGNAPLSAAEQDLHIASACRIFQALGAARDLAAAQALLPTSQAPR